MSTEEMPIDAMIGRFLDGESEPDDGAALARAMTNDPRVANEVRSLLMIDGLLHQAADTDAAAFTEAVSMTLGAQEEEGADFTQVFANRLQAFTPSSKNRWRRIVQIVGCVAVAACLALIWLGSRPQSHGPEAPVAVMINEVNARFAENGVPAGVNLAAGNYHLQTGTVHLRFASGAEIIVRSPAKFAVIDRMNMSLSAGTLRAVVPVSAQGFAVHTADVRYVDLGTEFGVSVGGLPNESRLHVFEGRVDLKNREGLLLSSFEEGASVRVTGEIRAYRSETRRRVSKRCGNWFGEMARLECAARKRSRAGLLLPLHCRSRRSDGSQRPFLKPAAVGWSYRGRPVGDGRWPGKQALLFDGDGEHVKVEIPARIGN